MCDNDDVPTNSIHWFDIVEKCCCDWRYMREQSEIRWILLKSNQIQNQKKKKKK